MNFRNVWEDTLDVGKSVGKGLLSGTENALNGATLGGYRWLGDKVGLGVSQRAEELQQQADAAGVGGLNHVGNFFAEMGGSLRGLSNLGYNAIRKGISILAPQMSKSVVAPNILSGTAESAINSTFENDFLNWQEVGKDTVQGLGISTLLSGFGTLANKGLRSLRDYMTLPYTNIEIMNFAPTREQLSAIKAESKFNPGKYLTREDADILLRDRVAIQKLNIYNDEASYLTDAVDKKLGIQHFIGDDRRPFIRTLNNTIKNPDLTFVQDGKDYFVKKYTNSENGKDFYDLAFKKGNKLFNKFPKSSPNGIVNQINNETTKNLSFGGRLSQATGRGTNPLTGENIDNVPLREVVVNSKLPHISSLYEGLNDVQRQQFGDSFQDVITNNSQKLGTLGSMYQLCDNLVNKPYLSSIADKLNEAILTAEQKTNMPKWTRLLQSMPNKFNSKYPYFANTLSWMGSREY
ncbi:MAG: hypothetical protein IJZ59_02960 [Alphaproteobacteria bacterium]|nr:hypothetical protein [Alphaproteobacteria bacterium]